MGTRTLFSLVNLLRNFIRSVHSVARPHLVLAEKRRVPACRGRRYPCGIGGELRIGRGHVCENRLGHSVRLGHMKQYRIRIHLSTRQGVKRCFESGAYTQRRSKLPGRWS